MERVDLTNLVLKTVFDRCRDVTRLQDTLIRGFGHIMHLYDFRANPTFFKQFDRWQKEVVQEPPLAGIEVIE